MECVIPSQLCSYCPRIMECSIYKKYTTEETKQSDPVNHPSHYTNGGVECIDAIKASMSKDEFLGYLKGNCIKYIWRYRNKGKEKEDLQKAQWYLNRLLEEL